MAAAQLTVTSEQLTRWAAECLSITHLNTLVQREIEANSLQRATDLSERARTRAWKMLNEMFAAGAMTILMDVVTLVGIVAILLAIDWHLALVSLSLLPVMMEFAKHYRSRRKHALSDAPSAD